MTLSQFLLNFSFATFGGALLLFLLAPLQTSPTPRDVNRFAWPLFTAASLSLLVSVLTRLDHPSAKLWLSLVCCAIAFWGHKRQKLSAAGPMVTPIVLILLFVELFTKPHFPNWRPTAFANIMLNSHIILAVLGEAFAIFAFIIAVLFMIQNNALKSRQLSHVSNDLPALDKLGKILIRCVWLGFIMLGLSLLTGSIYSQLYVDRQTWALDAKVLWAVIVWLWYLLILIQRNILHKPTKDVAMMCAVGFVLLLFGFFGFVFNPIGG